MIGHCYGFMALLLYGAAWSQLLKLAGRGYDLRFLLAMQYMVVATAAGAFFLLGRPNAVHTPVTPTVRLTVVVAALLYLGAEFLSFSCAKVFQSATPTAVWMVPLPLSVFIWTWAVEMWITWWPDRHRAITWSLVRRWVIESIPPMNAGQAVSALIIMVGAMGFLYFSRPR